MLKVGKSQEQFTLKSVFSQMPLAFVYCFIGSCLGTIVSFTLFFLNRQFLTFLLEIWIRRLTIGTELLGGHYTLWFMINNIVALMLVVVVSVLILSIMFKRRRFSKRFAKFKRFSEIENQHPKITLYSAYMIPIGALMINGFIVTLFITYTLLNYGIETCTSAVILMLPHGVNEFVALLIASSLGLSYLNILSPMIRKRQSIAMEIGKSLLLSKTTLFFVGVIFLLIIFSSFVEGILTLFVI